MIRQQIYLRHSPLIRKKLNFDKIVTGNEKLKIDKKYGQQKKKNHIHHTRNKNFFNLNDSRLQSKTLADFDMANSCVLESLASSNITSPSHRGDGTHRTIEWKTPKNQSFMWESTSKANSFVNSFNFKLFNLIRKLYVMRISKESQANIVKSMRQLMIMEAYEKVSLKIYQILNNQIITAQRYVHFKIIHHDSVQPLLQTRFSSPQFKVITQTANQTYNRGAKESSYYKFHRSTLNQPVQERPYKGRAKTPQLSQSRGFNFAQPHQNTSVYLQKVQSDDMLSQFGFRSPTRGKKQSQALKSSLYSKNNSFILSHSIDINNQKHLQRSPRKVARQNSMSNSPVRSRPQEIKCQFTSSMQGIAGFG